MLLLLLHYRYAAMRKIPSTSVINGIRMWATSPNTTRRRTATVVGPRVKNEDQRDGCCQYGAGGESTPHPVSSKRTCIFKLVSIAVLVRQGLPTDKPREKDRGRRCLFPVCCVVVWLFVYLCACARALRSTPLR